MNLKNILSNKFSNWKPPQPEVLSRTKCDITLIWHLELEPFGFLENKLLYKLEKQEKIPPWVVVYSGGKTSKIIGDLAPRHPQKFRLKVILKASAVASLVEDIVKYYGNTETVYDKLKEIGRENKEEERNGNETEIIGEQCLGDGSEHCYTQYDNDKQLTKSAIQNESNVRKWLESQWSEETWTSTDTDGPSAVSFCMAVRCGYIKQLQTMLEERPELIDIASTNGLSPLSTAIRRGDLNTVRFLLQTGADVNQASSTGQMPLHLAALGGNVPIIDLLLEKEADFQAHDINGLHVEHYAVDSCNVEVVKYILDRGGDVDVQDNNGWTPLFRAICQGANTKLIEELIFRGCSVDVTDRAGLTLAAAARLLKDKNGRRRESVLRRVDATFPREKALAHFSRLTKKISSVHSLLK